MLGAIEELYPREDSGWILSDEGVRFFFHKFMLVRANFSDLQVGTRVEFMPSARSFDEDEVGEERRAANVRLAQPS